MSRGALLRRFPVLAIRDFRLLLADRLIAPASVGFSMVGVSFAAALALIPRDIRTMRTGPPAAAPGSDVLLATAGCVARGDVP